MAKNYKGYTIKKGFLGWFGIPEHEDANKDRWGNTPNFNTRIECEAWIDNEIENNTTER